MPDLSEFEQIDRVTELERINGDLQRRLKSAKAKGEDLVQAVYQGAKDAAMIHGRAPAIPKPKADRRSKRAQVAVLLASDWHFGKQTESFNMQVAAQRIRLLAAKVAQMTEIERADHPVREAHLLVNGDMAENMQIFPGQAYEVDATLFEQMFTAARALEDLVRALLATFERVTVWTQDGNHGRIGRRGEMPRQDNIDRMIYRIARDRLDGDERLAWNDAEDWYTIVQIGSYRALLLHGHQIKSFGGNTPAFGITRKVNAWASGVLPPFTDCYMSHFHQPLVLPIANGKGRTFVNPALESDSGYAKEFVAATGTPGQLLKFVDPQRGRVTTERVLWLDED